MDLVTISLDLLLAALLVAALAYGVRLEKRLKGLRDGQAAFAQAVRDLDAAATRASAGLEQLQLAGEEARDGLHDRILKAREARADLERLISRAERARSGLAPLAPTPALKSAAPVRTAAEPQGLPDEDAAERLASAILSLGDAERMVETPDDRPAGGLRGAVTGGRRPLRPALRLDDPAPEPRQDSRRAPSMAPGSEPRPARRPRGLDEDLFDTPATDLRRAGRDRA
jgi:hypothetical protein